MSMPIRVRRRVSVFVRGDIVSIRQLMLAWEVPGFLPVFTMSFTGVRGGLGCGRRGRGRLQNELPLARCPAPGILAVVT